MTVLISLAGRLPPFDPDIDVSSEIHLSNRSGWNEGNWERKNDKLAFPADYFITTCQNDQVVATFRQVYVHVPV